MAESGGGNFDETGAKDGMVEIFNSALQRRRGKKGEV
jgi:hypothetical protein